MKNIGIQIKDSDPRILPGVSPDDGGRPVDFERIVGALSRQRRVYVLWLLVLVVLAIVITATTPPTYEASARIMLVSEDANSIDALAQREVLTNNDVRSAEQVLRSRVLADRVVGELDLSNTEAFTDRPTAMIDDLVSSVRNAARQAINAVTGLGSQSNEEPAVTLTEEEELLARTRLAGRTLQGEIRVARVGSSPAIEITYQSHDPALTAAVVNTYAEMFLLDQLQTALDRSERTTEWLQNRLDDLEEDARQAAVVAQQFAIDNNLVTVRDELVSRGNLDRFNVDLIEARTEAARLAARVDAFETVLEIDPAEMQQAQALLTSLPGGERLSLLSEFLGSLEARRGEVIRNFGADHPQVAILQAQIDDAAQRLFAEVTREANIARGERDVAMAHIAAIEAALEPLIAENEEASRAIVELQFLEQRAEALQNLYGEFFVEFEEAYQFTSFPRLNIRILSTADAPPNAIGPSTTRAVLLAALLTLFLGSVHAALREWRDRSIRTASDVTDTLQLPFLGYLPILAPKDRCTMADFEKRTASSTGNKLARMNTAQSHRMKLAASEVGLPMVQVPLIGLGNPYSTFSETLRNIRNNVNRARSRREGNIIAVTSLSAGEGKSTVVTDLADVFALQHGRTLLVDLDPRTLNLSRSLGLNSPNGMTEVLRSDLDWRSGLSRIAGTEVDVLGWSAASVTDNPSELLGSAALQEVLAEAAKNYEFVVLDLPPLGPTVDAREVLPLVDHLILLARWGHTPTKALRTLLDNEPELRDRLVGAALNMVHLKSLRNYVAFSSVPITDSGYGTPT